MRLLLPSLLEPWDTAVMLGENSREAPLLPCSEPSLHLLSTSIPRYYRTETWLPSSWELLVLRTLRRADFCPKLWDRVQLTRIETDRQSTDNSARRSTPALSPPCHSTDEWVLQGKAWGWSGNQACWGCLAGLVDKNWQTQAKPLFLSLPQSLVHIEENLARRQETLFWIYNTLWLIALGWPPG